MRYLSISIGALLIVTSFAIGRVTAPAPASAAIQPMVRFSHFECYAAQMKPVQAQVKLTDQFQSYSTSLGPPQFFCTPVVKKVISGPHVVVPAPADHLTCYQIQGPSLQTSRPYTNQFIQDTVGVGTPQLLCVPTNKQG
jgi:hypothetical protein